MPKKFRQSEKTDEELKMLAALHINRARRPSEELFHTDWRQRWTFLNALWLELSIWKEAIALEQNRIRPTYPFRTIRDTPCCHAVPPLRWPNDMCAAIGHETCWGISL